MSKKLYCGNLDYSVTSEDLEELFSQAGKVVSAIVISNKFTGRSKGFGFVEMSNDEEATKAIEMFNEKDFKGRKMLVNGARPRVDRNDSAAGNYNNPQ